jgi:hypothetical protein
MVFGRTRFVSSGAKWSSVTSASDTPVARTNLKGNLGNTEDSLHGWIQLQGVNLLLVSTWKTGPLRIRRHLGYRPPQPSQSIRSSVGSIPLTILRVYGAKCAESPSMRRLLAGRDGQLQSDQR